MNIKDAIRIVSTDKERKSFFRIGAEALHCAFIERELPLYYFTSLLYQKGAADYRHFIGHRRIRRIVREFFHQGGDHTLLENKLKFGQILERNGIEAPQLLGWSNGRTVSVANRNFSVNNVSELAQIVQRIIKYSASEAIFVKPVDGFGGQDTFRLHPIMSAIELNDLYQLMATTDFLFQDYVTQHEKVNSVYPESLNTLRVHAYVDPIDKEVQILSALMRFGSGGNIVDNATSAGFFVPVDLATWTLRGKGKSFLHSGARTFKCHPDSGVRLDGFALPYGDESKALIARVARIFDKPFVGWDIALSNHGPVVIEGNHMPHLVMAQIAGGGLRGHPGFSKMLEGFI